MKFRKAQLTGALLGAFFLTICACSKDPENTSSPAPGVHNEASAEEFFKTFQFSQVPPKVGPAKYAASKILKLKDLEEAGHAVFFKLNLYLLDNHDYVLEYIQVEDRKPDDGKTIGEGMGRVAEGRWHIDGKNLVLEKSGEGRSGLEENKPAILFDPAMDIAIEELKARVAKESIVFREASTITRLLGKDPKDLRNHLPTGEINLEDY